MAVMNIGFGIFLICLGIGFGSEKNLRGFFQNLLKEITQPDAKRLGGISIGLYLAIVASLVSCALYPLQYNGHVEGVHASDFLKVWYFVIPFLVALAFRGISRAQRDHVFRVWIIAFGLLCVLGLFQFFFGWPRKQWIPFLESRYHVTLFLGHHLSVASIFIFPFFATLDFIRSPAQKVLPRKILIAIALIAVPALFLTFSRILWIALPLGGVVWALLQLPRPLALKLFLGLALLAGGISQVPAIHDRLTNKIGYGPREHLWDANRDLFLVRPMFGVGFRKNEKIGGNYMIQKWRADKVFQGHAHNNLLEMLAGTGLVGTTFWIAWNLVVFGLIWKGAFQSSTWGIGLLVAWAVLHLNGITQVNFWESKVMHQMMLSLGFALSLLPLSSKRMRR